ncbi:YwqG family protein [Phenylobacterium sp.]|uniref:YwqG family protein n=1 Tax=Phenylobacterium sp. TaxID=1871053 RepID=UPI00273208AD|nr:YwqG family protein [Phenylobacterium sp.]MDP1616013.1 YwqG family protein [Phenylobacterium sp.]MDP1986891.1 YwqG family protein [Phenylobacterium sp.]
MGLFKGLFGGREKQPPPPPSDKVLAIQDELRRRVRPCLRLRPEGEGVSRLGGEPELTGEWPAWKGGSMAFVAQLDLAEMRAAGGPDWLPATGRLLFFCEPGAWGDDPEDAGSAMVRHETAPAEPRLPPLDLPRKARIQATPVSFEAGESWPSEERLEIDWDGMGKQDYIALEAFVEAHTPEPPAHQVGGYPGAVQDDAMEAICQEMTKSSGALEDWRLLLQVDSARDQGMQWFDTGRLYFWIREQDARAGDFSKVWLIVQSG